MRPIRSLAAAVLVAAVAVAGCGRTQPDQPSAPGSQPPAATAAPATTAPAAGATSASPVVLPDGRHPVLIKRIDPARRTIRFDLVQWYTGEAAAKAAAEDHQESPPPNDYYVRNVNPRLRTLPVAADATITANQVVGSNQDVPVTLARLAGVPHVGDSVFWITVRHDQVLKISEQWVP